MRFWFLFILAALIISCEKKFMNGHVTVHAYNVLNGEGLEGVHVSVTKMPLGDLGNSKTAGEGYTDINGNLEFNFSRYKISKTWFIGRSFDNDDYVEIDFIESGNYYKDIELEIQYAPIASLDVDLINQNCYNANDSLFITEINLVTGDSAYSDHWNTATHQYNGVLVTGCFQWDVPYTTFNTTNAGNRRYYGYIKRDNGTTYFDTTIFVQPGIDNFIELFF